MAAVARAGAHRRVKDDEVVAHYARADDGSPGVIRIGELAERVVVALPRLCILGIRNDPAASDELSTATTRGSPRTLSRACSPNRRPERCYRRSAAVVRWIVWIP